VQECGEGSGGPVAYLAPREDDDDGYMSPHFDLSSVASDDEQFQKPSKRRRRAGTTAPGSNAGHSLAADEELVLRLLSGSR